MSWAGQEYAAAATGLDDHLAHCTQCGPGGYGCADGDDAAEAEFRAYMQLRHVEPDEARNWGRDRVR
jgi:hypothetical protein